MEKSCCICRKKFLPHRKTQKFCSSTCVQISRWKNVKTKKKICSVCGEKFQAIFDRRTTCSSCGERICQLRSKMKRAGVIKLDVIPEMLKKLVCDICGKPEIDEGRDLALDHIGDTIRGRLCRRHNTALGLFGDDPDLLRKAADYVERARAQRT